MKFGDEVETYYPNWGWKWKSRSKKGETQFNNEFKCPENYDVKSVWHFSLKFPCFHFNSKLNTNPFFLFELLCGYLDFEEKVAMLI